MSSSWLPSLSSHILHSCHSLFCFLLSFSSVFLLFCVVAHNLFCLFHLFLSCFLHFLLFTPLLIVLGFLISCALTTSPHFPSSDPSGPETPSFSAHRPLPPPKVLTPQHTALCAAVHTLRLWRGLLPKHVCPHGSALVGVSLWVYWLGGQLGIRFAFSQWKGVYRVPPL